MCGICGFNWQDEELVKRMTEKIHHRGPDVSGEKVFPGMSMGNARLSIIDLSENGNQPMVNRYGNLWIVYNGEIYNFPEIKKDLDVSNFAEVMTVDDGGETVRMWMKAENAVVSEFLLIVGGDDNVLIYITGDFNLNDLEGLAESFDHDIDIDL